MSHNFPYTSERVAIYCLARWENEKCGKYLESRAQSSDGNILDFLDCLPAPGEAVLHSLRPHEILVDAADEFHAEADWPADLGYI